MKDLHVKILCLRNEIDDLSRCRDSITSKIKDKKQRLKELELLTVNQLDMFDKSLD